MHKNLSKRVKIGLFLSTGRVAHTDVVDRKKINKAGGFLSNISSKFLLNPKERVPTKCCVADCSIAIHQASIYDHHRTYENGSIVPLRVLTPGD